MTTNTTFLEIRAAAPVISAGVMSANLTSLGTELELMETAGVKCLHVDVMDGRFCPMMTAGPPLVRAMRTELLKDVHLMIEEPLAHVESFVAAGADAITVHVESSRHVHRTLQVLGEMTAAARPDRRILRGVALNPSTPVEAVRPLLDETELVLLLAVNPGWRGQRFIPATERKCHKLEDMLRETRRDVLVGIDGGVTMENVADIAAMGVDIIVAGSAIFDGKAPLENAQRMIAAAREAARAR